MSTKQVISAGVLLECADRFLIGHPTELTGTTHGWGILKGRRDDNGETLLQTAFREFQEESGMNLWDWVEHLHYVPRPFYTYKVNGNKTVYVYWVCGISNMMTQKLHCPSIVPGTDKPEIDDYAWVTADEAIDKVTESQKDLFRLVKKLTTHK